MNDFNLEHHNTLIDYSNLRREHQRLLRSYKLLFAFVSTVMTFLERIQKHHKNRSWRNTASRFLDCFKHPKPIEPSDEVFDDCELYKTILREFVL